MASSTFREYELKTFNKVLILSTRMEMYMKVNGNTIKDVAAVEKLNIVSVQAYMV